MKNRTKLSFSQLQAEMSEEKQLITEEKELAQLSGGLSIDEFVALMQGWGFDFRNDASGNYYYESLPDVVVSSSYEQVYGMSYDQWYNQYGYLTNLSNPYHGTDPSWQGYPNTYPGTGGGGGGGTNGTGTNGSPTVPILLESNSGFGWSSKSYLISQNDAYNMLSSTGAVNSWVNGSLSLAAGINNTFLGTVLGLLTTAQGSLISSIQDNIHHNNGENVIFHFSTNVTGDGTNIATTITFEGENSGRIYGTLTY